MQRQYCPECGECIAMALTNPTCGCNRVYEGDPKTPEELRQRCREARHANIMMLQGSAQSIADNDAELELEYQARARIDG